MIVAVVFGRMSSIFNAFMANLPQVLDQNHVMGASIAEPTLMLLQVVNGLKFFLQAVIFN